MGARVSSHTSAFPRCGVGRRLRGRKIQVPVYQWQRYALTLKRRYFFSEICATVTVKKRNLLQDINFGGFFSSKGLAKTILECGDPGCRIISARGFNQWNRGEHGRTRSTSI
jgi:hypothetical protein